MSRRGRTTEVTAPVIMPDRRFSPAAVRRITRIACCAGLLFVAPLAAVAEDAPASNPLIASVPSDVGIYIEVDRYATNSELVFTGDIYQWLEQFPPVDQWAVARPERLRNMVRLVVKHCEFDAETAWRSLFSNRVAFAVWPNDELHDDADAGLVIFEADESDRLQQFVQGFLDAQRELGAAVEEKQTDAGITYYAVTRVRNGKDLLVHIAADGNVGLIGSVERTFVASLDLRGGGDAKAPSLADLPIHREGNQRLSPDAAVQVYVNPRRWDAVIGDSLNQNDLLENAAWHLWRACEFIVSSIEIGQPIRIGTYAQIDRKSLPPELVNLTENFIGTADFLERIPADSMVAAAGRLELFRLAQYLLSGMEPERRATIDLIRGFASGMLLGQDLVDDVLPQLGPNIGAFLLPEDTHRQSDWVIGLQVREPADEDQPRIEETIQAALELVGVSTTDDDPAANDSDQNRSDDNPRDGNHQSPRATVEVRGGVNYTEISGLPFLPSGMALTYAFHDNYLLAGTSTDAVSRSVEVANPNSFANSSRFHSLVNVPVSAPSHVLFVDCRALETLMDNHSDVILDALASAGGGGAKAAQRRLDDLQRWLAMVESLLLAAQFDDHGLALSVTVDERADRDARAD